MRARASLAVCLVALAILTKPVGADSLDLLDSYGRAILHARDAGGQPLQLPPSPPDQTLHTTALASGPLFAPYQSYPLAYQARAVAIGDVTGDGRPDLVATEEWAPVVDVFAQTAAGTLAPPVPYPAPLPYASTFSGSVAIADLNGDGRRDVVVTSTNAVTVLLQQADGHLGAPLSFATIHSSFSNAFKLVTGDFNHDGRADVASIDWGTQSDEVDVFLQPSGGVLSPPVSYIAVHDGYDDMEAGDINADGRDDIVVMSGQSFSPNLAVLSQTAQGTFGSPAYYSISPFDLCQGVGVGDVNGDGRQDVVASHGGNGPSAQLAIFLQGAGGALQPSFNLPSLDIPGPVAVADLNGDGRDDVVTLHDGWLAMGVYLQGSGGSLGTETLYTIPYASWYNSHGLALGDLNGDGKADVAIADPNVGVEVLYNIGQAASPVVTVDLAPDVLKLGSAGRWITCYLEPSAPFGPSQIDLASLRLNGAVPVDPAAAAVVGDYDLDGIPDLAVKFDRLAVELAVSEGDAVQVTVTGQIAGQAFSANDVIRVLRGVVTSPAAGSVLSPGSTHTISWETPDGVTATSVTVLYSLDDGVSWTSLASGLPNTGSFDWMVPDASSDQVKIAILAEVLEANGEIATDVLATSGTFTIAGPTGVGGDDPVALALQAPRPNPARSRFHVELSLPGSEPGTLALFDLGGRKLTELRVAGAGRHVVDLGAASLPAGMYLIRLSHGAHQKTVRAALIR